MPCYYLSFGSLSSITVKKIHMHYQKKPTPFSIFLVSFLFIFFFRIAIGKVKKKNLRKNRAAVVQEYQLYIEEAFICNILTFLDKSLLHVGLVKVFVEVVERRFAKKALRRRSKEGLFEVPGSRSPSIRLKNEDIICIEMEGNIQRMKEIPLQNYFIVFLSSARDNFRTFSVEPRKDPEKRAYGKEFVFFSILCYNLLQASLVWVKLYFSCKFIWWFFFRCES